VVTGFDRITVAVPDLAAALEQYAAVLGSASSVGESQLFELSNVSIELVEAPDLTTARVSGLTVIDAQRAAGDIDTGQRGVCITSVPQRRHQQIVAAESGISAVDHLVLMTRDADDCIRLFGEQLGMRLALDQLVPEWGGRMLFFRCGKMTLEIIHNIEDPPEQDQFWGITYLSHDLDTTIASFEQRGVAYSEVRDGRKPGTRVTTVKSHNLGLPTLLLEPAKK
jgi:catechol 2,3-dioxygenase-like lactoylglutathione lyase family enzyme